MTDELLLESFLARCEGIRSKTAEELYRERELADIAFQLGQRVVLRAKYPDGMAAICIPALLHAAMRNYGAAVSLAFGGHEKSAVLTLMRVTLEATATAVRLKERPEMVDVWLNLSIKARDRKVGKLFQGEMKRFGQQYEWCCALGAHPNLGMAGDGVGRRDDGDTDLWFWAPKTDQIVRSAYFSASLMLDLAVSVLVPTFWPNGDGPEMPELQRARDLTEEIRRARAKALAEWSCFRSPEASTTSPS